MFKMLPSLVLASKFSALHQTHLMLTNKVMVESSRAHT